MPKPIIINKRETLRFIADVMSNDCPGVRRELAQAGAPVVLRKIERDPGYARRVHTPRPSDPAWVAERLAEGKPVFRIATSRFGMFLACRGVVSDLRDLRGAMHRAGDQYELGICSWSEFQRVERIFDNVSAMHPDELRRHVEREWRRTNANIRRHEAHRPDAAEMAASFAEPRTVACGQVEWR